MEVQTKDVISREIPVRTNEEGKDDTGNTHSNSAQVEDNMIRVVKQASLETSEK